jgi:hypothetical protein
MASVSQLQTETNQTIAWFNTFLDNTRSQWLGTSKEPLVTPLIMGVKAAAYQLTQKLAEAARTRPAGGSDLDQTVVQFKSFAASSAESIKSLIQTPAQRQQTRRRETAPPGGNVVVPAPDASTTVEDTGPSLEEQLATSREGSGAASGSFNPWLIVAGLALGVIGISAAMRRRGGGMNGLDDEGSDCGCGG